MKINVELAFFFTLLIIIAGTFLVAQGTGSITGAVISTLPAEETILVNESMNISLEPTMEVNNEPSAQPEMIRKESSSIGMQEISIQNAPSIAIVLNTTNLASNDTNVNLTAYNTSQTNGNSLKVIYNWLVNGSPMAILNMPFEGINNTPYNNTLDYSGLGNHGNDSHSARWNATGGYDGKGAYDFDGNDFINLTNQHYFESVCNSGCTFTSWIKWGNKSSDGMIVARRDSSLQFFTFSALTDTMRLQLVIGFNGTNTGANQCIATSATSLLQLNAWHHVAGRYNGTHTSLFINGTQQVATACTFFTAVNYTTWQAVKVNTHIGNLPGLTANGFNGTLDDVIIFNRSLSKEQIYALSTNQTNVIVAQETQRGENWTVHATPNNGTGDGTVAISNNVTILNIKPTISSLVLNTTNLATNNTEVNLTAYATTSDVDADSVKVIYNWLVNNIPLAFLNMPFEGVNRSTNTTWDYSGTGNTGSENLGVLWNASGGYDGKGAYQFDGVNDYIGFTTASNPKNISMVAWIKPLTSVTVSEQAVLDYGTALFTINVPTSSYVFYPNVGQAAITCSISPTLTSEQWHHVAVTYNYLFNATNGNISCYLNGALIESKIHTVTDPGTNTLRNIGRYGGDSRYFNGTIDEVIVFNRTLSPQEIYALWINQSNVIVAQETTYGENWTVQATPNDRTDDGTAVISNNLSIKDITAPQVTFNTPTNGSNFSSSTQIFNVTVTDSEAGVGTVLFIFNSNTTPFNVTASNTGSYWNASISMSSLIEGRHTVIAYANDTINNINNTVNINITVDRTSPNVTINSLNANNMFNASNYSVRSGNITFNASVFDVLTGVNRVYFWLDNGTGSDINITGVNNSGQWTISYNVSSLAEGRQGVRIIANDTVNNINDTYFMNFTVDFTSPNVTINSLNANNMFNASNYSVRSGNITFNASVFDVLTGVSRVYFWLDNGTGNDVNATAVNQSGNWIVSYNVSTLAEGKQGVRIIANDTVNNINDTYFMNFTVDFTSPNVTINYNFVDNSNFSIRSSNQTFNASVFDSLLLVGTVYFWFDNGTSADINITGLNTSGQWTVSYNVSTLAEGKQGVRIIANDTVNNVNNSAAINFTIDFTGPNVNITGPATGATLSSIQNFNATVQDSVTDVNTVLFQFSNGTNPFNLTASNTSGIWNVSINTNSIIEGAITVTVIANDTVGNVNSTKTISITIDNIAEPGSGGGASSTTTSTPSTSTTSKVVKPVTPSKEEKDEEQATDEKIAEEPLKEEEKIGETPASEQKDETVVKGKALAIFAAFFRGDYEESFQELKNSLQTVASTFSVGTKKVIMGIISSLVNYPLYWVLSALLLSIIFVGLHIKEMPVPEFLWKWRPAPEVKVEEPAILVSQLEQKPDIHLRDWGKKNYIDLQQELKRVETLLKDTPIPEQKNKALKITALKPSPTEQKLQIPKIESQQEVQLSGKELEHWITHLSTTGTPTQKIIAIIQNATSLNEVEIKYTLLKVRAAQLLQKTYSLNQKAIKELQEFIHVERKKGATVEQIIADLVREGWNENIIRLYVTAHYP